MSLPNRDELAEISSGLSEAGATSPTAEGFAAKAFDAGEFTPETFHSWLAVQKLENAAKLWPKATGKGNGASDEGDSSKSSNNPFLRENWSITEQGRLVKLNPTMAAALAKSAGVKIGSTKPIR